MKRKITVLDANWFQLTDDDAFRFNEAKKKLASLASTESTVLQMELIFFDTLGSLKKYEHPKAAELLQLLRQIQENEYQRVHYPKLTTKMRATAIRTFKNGLRIVLTKAINKPLRKKASFESALA